jgi:hypothetical protein
MKMGIYTLQRKHLQLLNNLAKNKFHQLCLCSDESWDPITPTGQLEKKFQNLLLFFYL